MSSPRRPNRPVGGARRPNLSAERAELLRGISMNSQTITVAAMVVLGIFVLAPQAQLWFQQRQSIADLEEQVRVSKESLTQLKVQRNRWNDPAYVRAQARNRLFYVMPGEVSYIVMDLGTVNASDTSGTLGEALARRANSTDFSSKIRATKNDWMGSLVQTVVRAGVESPVTKK